MTSGPYSSPRCYELGIVCKMFHFRENKNYIIYISVHHNIPKGANCRFLEKQRVYIVRVFVSLPSLS